MHTRLRVQRAPGVPHALFGREINAQLGRIAPRGANARLLFDNLHQPVRRPCESRDPYAVPSRCGTESETFHNNDRRWLWVPAFAGTTKESGWGGCERAARWGPRVR